MKKIYLLIAIMSLSLAGCGKAETSSDKKAPESNKSTESTVNIANNTNNDDNDTSTTTKATNSAKETTKSEAETSSLATSETTTQEQTQNTTTTQSQGQTTSATQSMVQNPTTTQPVTEVPTTTQPATEVPTTTQPATQPPAPTQPATEATTSKYVVEYTKELSTATESYKYGLKRLINTYDYYVIYSDGSKEKYDTYTYNSYDSSGYSATDAELLDESNSKAAANISYYNEVLTLVNEIRAEAGVAPLTLDTTLCQAATMRAVEMNYSDIFSHTRPNGTDCFTVLDTYNISHWGCGENIAAGYGSPSAVVTGWKNSPGHYANMINSTYTKLGVGLSDEEPGSYGKYWVQLFTN